MRQDNFIEVRDVNGSRNVLRRSDVVGVSEDPGTGRAVIIMRGGHSLVVDDKYGYDDVRWILDI